MFHATAAEGKRLSWLPGANLDDASARIVKVKRYRSSKL